MRFIIKGAPVAIAPLGKVPGSKVGIALVKNAPHPNAARLFIDWLTSPEGMLAYADPTLMLVAAPELQGKARANRFLSSLGVTYDLMPDELATPQNVNKSVEFWQKAVGLRG